MIDPDYLIVLEPGTVIRTKNSGRETARVIAVSDWETNRTMPNTNASALVAQCGDGTVFIPKDGVIDTVFLDPHKYDST